MTGRVGLLGGTFDPPHAAHVLMAQTAYRELALDRVLLLPAPSPPHKTAGELSPYRDRLEMARLAAEGVDGVEVSDLEEARTGPSYTVDTLRVCRERFGMDLYFIVGADSLRDLPSWRDPEKILGLCTLVVFPRDDVPMRLGVAGDASLVLFEEPRIDVSSTSVRAAIAAGESTGETLPAAVRAWIDRRSLYRNQ